MQSWYKTETDHLNEYLLETKEVNFSHPLIKSKANDLFHPKQSEIEKVKIAFEYVRDEIAHSLDIQGKRVTCSASDVLIYKEGICYAKSHLLAALLRSEGIPTGFCYQRVMLFDVPEKGHCIHALNAVFIRPLNKWLRLDARGNRKGIDAQFSIDEERLAFTIQEKYGEKDYPVIYKSPHPKTIAVLQAHNDPLEMCERHLPNDL